MPAHVDVVHKSKVDAWLGLLLLALAAMGPVSLAAGIYYLVVCRSAEGWVFIGSGLFVTGLMSLVVWPITYTLTSNHLVIRAGVFRSRLPYDTITAVYPTRNPLSSPALSLDRTRIDHTGRFGFALISPESRERFMRDLAERAPHLRIVGDRMERRPDR
jgi:hypothetical protein